MTEGTVNINVCFDKSIVDALNQETSIYSLLRKQNTKPHWSTRTFGEYTFPECNCDIYECFCEGSWDEDAVTIDWFHIPERSWSVLK